MDDITRVRKQIKARVLAAGSYSKIAREMGVNSATLWRFLNDYYEPKRPNIRKALGLEEAHAEN